MIAKNAQERDKICQVGRVVALTIEEMSKHLQPGITTRALDKIGAAKLKELGANSAPQKCYQFPGFTCISINEEAAHGIPSEREIQAGDVVNIDVSAEMDGFFADAGKTFLVESDDPVMKKLCQASQAALQDAIDSIRAGVRIDSLKKIYKKAAKKYGFSLIQNLCGHGLGRSLHEDPEHVPDFSLLRDTRKFKEGMVVAIEPFIATGHSWVYTDPDGWTLKGPDGGRSAQFEHTIIVTKDGCIVATQL